MTAPGKGWPTISSASRADLDQPLEVDAGRDPHLLAHEHQVLGADVARRPLMARERATAEARDRGIEVIDPHLQPCIRIGDPEAAGVVQVQRYARLRPALAHRAHQAADVGGRGPGHGVGKCYGLDANILLGRDLHAARDHLEHLADGHVAFEVAAERGHHREARHRQAVRPAGLDLARLDRGVVRKAAVLVALHEGLGRAERDRARQRQPVAMFQRPQKPLLVQPERGVRDVMAQR